MLIAVLFLWLPGGVLKNIYDICYVINKSDKGVDHALEELHIDANTYTKQDAIEAKSGKNIVVIGLESFEKGLLDDKLAHLTPNIRRLANKMTTFDMEQGEGSNWTSGSIYTMLTGIPAFFSSNSNATFHNTSKLSTPGLPQILTEANYQLSYFMSKPKYSGVDEMLQTFNFNVNPGINTEIYTDNEIPDLDLFELAKKQVQKHQNQHKSFALFLSTISTHFPDGIYDKRMESKIQPQMSNLEFMVAAVDYMVGDFISFLEEENLLDNTVFYILPDHLLMGHGARVLSDLPHPRSLFLITNASKHQFEKSETERIQQIDLPGLILKGAKIDHNVKFLSDFIDQESKAAFIRKNKKQLLNLNEAFLQKKSVVKFDLFRHRLAGWKNIAKARIHKLIYAPNNRQSEIDSIGMEADRFIAHAGGMVDGLRYTNSLEALEASYARGFKLFELDIIKTADNKFVAAHDWRSWAKTHSYKGPTPVSLEEFKKHKIKGKYTPLTMENINAWFSSHTDAILVSDKVNEPVQFASAFIDKNRLMMELFSIPAVKEAQLSGIMGPMISQNVFYKLKQNGPLLPQLQAYAIKHMALSRAIIEQNIPLFIKLQKHGIKIYVYHVNATPEFDEAYVVNNEIGYVYGLYADNWDFTNAK